MVGFNFLEKLYRPSNAEGIKTYMHQLNAYLSSKDVEIPSAIQLAHLRRVSPPNYVNSQIRSDNVGKFKFKVFDGDQALPEQHPLTLFFAGKHQFADLMRRSELSLCYFGYNLLYKLRRDNDIPTSLKWVNPTIYDTDPRSQILRWLIRGDTDNRKWEDYLERTIYPHDAVWLTEIDLLDDYDGLAPAEVAYITAMIGYEVDTTEKATFENGAVPPLLFQPAVDQAKNVKVNDSSLRKLMASMSRALKGSRNAGTNFGTVQRWDVKELRSAFKDLQLGHLDEKVWQTTSAVYGVPLSMVASYLVSSGLSRSEDSSDWAQSWLLPRGEWYASHFTEQLARDYKSTYRVELDKDSVPFLTEDELKKIETIELKSKTGAISLDVVQVALGEKPAPEFKNLHWYEGVGWVPIADFRNVWRYNLVIAPSTINAGIIPGDEIPHASGQTDQALLAQQAEADSLQATAQIQQVNVDRERNRADVEIEEDKVEIEKEDAGNKQVKMPYGYIDQSHLDKLKALPDSIRRAFTGKAVTDHLYSSITLTDDPAITEYCERLKEQFRNDDIEWVKPEEYHVTLAYSPNVSPDQANEIIADVPAELDFPVLVTHSLDVFEADDDLVPLVLLIHNQSGLQVFQEYIYSAFRRTRVEMSEHSKPSDWTPHVTLAYIPAELAKDFTPAEVVFGLDGQALVIQRNDYETIHEQVDPRVAILKREAKQELKNWRRKMKKEGKSVEFEFEYLPENVVRFVRRIQNPDQRLGKSRFINLDPEADGVKSALIDLSEDYDFWYSEAKKLLALKSIQSTRLDFEGDIENLLQRAKARNMPERVLRDRFRSIVSHYIRIAYEDGLIDGGVLDGSMSEDDLATIRALTVSATPLINKLVKNLLANDGITDGDIDNKPALWFAGTINPAYSAGLDSAGYNPMQEWAVNRTKDNCTTCKKLSGQRHRRNIYRKHNLHNPPRVGQATKCKGYRCGCNLRTVKGRAKGRIKAIYTEETAVA